MNPRIKQIAEETHFNIYNSPIWNGTGERFVEAIINECCVALNPMLRDMISRGQAVDAIKKHFGVE